MGGYYTNLFSIRTPFSFQAYLSRSSYPQCPHTLSILVVIIGYDRMLSSLCDTHSIHRYSSSNIPFLSTNIQACGHHFCSECWIGTIEGAIDAGPDCLFLLCPAGQCRLVVPDALVSKYITDVDKLQRYRRFQLDSFVSQNKASSFCPAPGCHRVIEYPKRDNTRVIVCVGNTHY